MSRLDKKREQREAERRKEMDGLGEPNFVHAGTSFARRIAALLRDEDITEDSVRLATVLASQMGYVFRLGDGDHKYQRWPWPGPADFCIDENFVTFLKELCPQVQSEWILGLSFVANWGADVRSC